VSQIDSDEPALPVIEGTRVAARHIVPAAPSSTGAVEVLPGAWWAPAESTGLTGPGGWVSASLERRSRDASQLQGLVLPNAPGDDGIEHRDRFRDRTDPEYRLGMEWIELVDETTNHPFGVVTPETARVDRSSVNIGGPDAAAMLSGFREGKVAPWTPRGPLDVIDWYSRAPQQVVAHNFRAAADGAAGWTTATVSGGTSAVEENGLHLRAANSLGGASALAYRAIAPSEAVRAWSLTVALIRNAGDNYGITGHQGTNANGSEAWSCGYFGGAWTFTVAGQSVSARMKRTELGGAVEIGVTAIDGWMIATVDGAVIGSLRRGAVPNQIELASVSVHARTLAGMTTDITVQNAAVQVARPFLRRGAPDPDYRVAGAPTPGGLRGDYFLTYDEWVRSGGNFAKYGAQVPAPLAEPYQQRLDETVSFTGLTWMPPGPPNGEGFAVRWSGSIYLDPAVTDTLRLADVDDMARLWVGPTRDGDAMIDAWGLAAAGTHVEYLVDRLGAGWLAGWYPIVLEYAQGPSGGAAITLQRWNGSGFIAVPSTELSPYGCFEGDLGGESFRGAIDSVANTSGLNWMVRPKTLESGEFPGRLEVGRRLGRDTDYILGEAEATEYVSEVRAADVVDAITADAQGLGDNLGREGLTATITDPSVVGRPWIFTRAETLTDITEKTLLQQRLASLLALYSTPAEEIQARPRGVQTLSDSFPTDGSALPAAAQKLLWEPDEGVRCRFPSIGVEDQTPRALTAVTWPLTPVGRGAPSVGFRQRPRHFRETLRRLQRGVALQRRRYQGQLSEALGALGGSSGVDGSSRIGLPPGKVARLAVRIPQIAGSGTVEINGVSTGLTVSRPGEYDVTAWLPADQTYVYARLTGSPGIHLLQIVATGRL
jgi:hypothetical protein